MHNSAIDNLEFARTGAKHDLLYTNMQLDDATDTAEIQKLLTHKDDILRHLGYLAHDLDRLYRGIKTGLYYGQGLGAVPYSVTLEPTGKRV